MFTDDRPYDAFTPRNMTDEDIADEIERDSGRPVPRPTSPAPTVASVTAAIPAQLRNTFPGRHEVWLRGGRVHEQLRIDPAAERRDLRPGGRVEVRWVHDVARRVLG